MPDIYPCVSQCNDTKSEENLETWRSIMNFDEYKIINTNDKTSVNSVETIAATIPQTINIDPVLRRAFLFLEDGEWERANDFCEQVLNIDPENARAYLGKLLAELQVNLQENLSSCRIVFDKNNNYQKIVKCMNML